MNRQNAAGRMAAAGCEFPVNGKSVKSKLYSVSDAAIVKKAIVEKLNKHIIKHGLRNRAKVQNKLPFLKDRATLTIDTNGPAHKEHRELTAPAPLETWPLLCAPKNGRLTGSS